MLFSHDTCMAMMPISEMLIRTMMMGKIRFTAGNIYKKLFPAKIAERCKPQDGTRLLWLIFSTQVQQTL